MKTIIASLLLLVSFQAHAVGALQTVWLCQETHQGAIIRDGAKQVFITRDSANQFYFSAVQRDQFSGDQVFINNSPLQPVKCAGFARCAIFVGTKLSGQAGAFELFMNDLSGNYEARLKMKLGSQPVVADFTCKKM